MIKALKVLCWIIGIALGLAIFMALEFTVLNFYGITHGTPAGTDEAQDARLDDVAERLRILEARIAPMLGEDK